MEKAVKKNTTQTHGSQDSPKKREGKYLGCEVEGALVGRSDGVGVGLGVGAAEGVPDGCSEGEGVGEGVGFAVGASVGTLDGRVVGLDVGLAVGIAVGRLDGRSVGLCVGAGVGSDVGLADGVAEGRLVDGALLGYPVRPVCFPSSAEYNTTFHCADADSPQSKPKKTIFPFP